MTVGNGVDVVSSALRRVPRSMVEVEVGSVLLVPADDGVLVQLVYDRVDGHSEARATLVAVHHSDRELPVSATYERLHPGAALLAPAEVGAEFPRGRGLRWLAPDDPGRRAWSTGARLVRLVDDAASAGLLAAHFGVPLLRERPNA